ncbi:MAG: hypothetical protein AAF518_05690 [Spirochaetota bacterium]
MKIAKKVFNLILLLGLFWQCQTVTPKKPKDVIDYIQYGQKKYYRFDSPKSQPLVELLRELEGKVTSFTSDFTMVLQTGKGLREERVLDGKLYFDKEKQRMRVNLMAEALFFKITVAEVIADPQTIQLKRLNDKKPYVQPMGNIEMQDPNTKKIISIPFQVIYHSISLKFLEEFQNGNSFFSPEEKRVLVKRDGDVYQYVFSANGLEALDYASEGNNVKAISKVTAKDTKGLHPPQKIQTRATEFKTGEDTGLIDIKYRNVRRGIKVQDSWFRF